MRFISWVLIALGANGGCIEVDSEGEVSLRGDSTTTCPTWKCGFNSAEVNGRAIRELNLDGLANTSGMRIVGFIAPAGVLGNFALTVERDALVARSPQGVTLRGKGLIGATIVVEQEGQPGSLAPITVHKYEEIPSWAAGAPDVATYALVYPDAQALLGVRNVCTGSLVDALSSAAVVLGGETYDDATKTVHSDLPRWFTIACAGSAAAKMRLMNYGPQSDFYGPQQPASPLQRQATLKMITADYCGGGHSYTQNGTPLQWENSEGNVVSPALNGAIEAYWGPLGARCLGTTRLSAAAVQCSLPSCAGFSLAEAEWATYVPPAT